MVSRILSILQNTSVLQATASCFFMCKKNGRLEFLSCCKPSCHQKFGRYKLKQNIKGQTSLQILCVQVFVWQIPGEQFGVSRHETVQRPRRWHGQLSGHERVNNGRRGKSDVRSFFDTGLSKPYSLPSVFDVCSVHAWLVCGGALREIQASSLAPDQTGCHRPWMQSS